MLKAVVDQQAWEEDRLWGSEWRTSPMAAFSLHRTSLMCCHVLLFLGGAVWVHDEEVCWGMVHGDSVRIQMTSGVSGSPMDGDGPRKELSK